MASTAPPNAYARGQTAMSGDPSAVCASAGTNYTGGASGTDANHTNRVTGAALPIHADRVVRGR